MLIIVFVHFHFRPLLLWYILIQEISSQNNKLQRQLLYYDFSKSCLSLFQELGVRANRGMNKCISDPTLLTLLFNQQP